MNYDELGFKCGIEIHQQLATSSKLFCDCPIDLKDEPADAQVQRYLRAVAGETGEKDTAAEYEAQKSKKYVYNYYSRNNCLVELDEEPPHFMDEEALETGLVFARMVNAEIPEEIQIMRKMVVDGSNTSGFQRTSMIGLDGEIETSEGTVKIDDIELEEESAGIHAREPGKAVYDLNRLGIPLIEVGTDASIKNPEHAREVAMKLGMLLRSTGKARRGIGTIRQDVNVSIEDGARVEIKGFQDVRNIDKLIENEVERQKNLVEIGSELNESLTEKLVRKLKSEELIELKEVRDAFEDTDNQIVSTVLENSGTVYALKLPNLAGKMKQPISDDRYLAKELVDYAKTQGVQGILHTDEDIEKYDLVDEFNTLKERFSASEEDVVAVIAGPEENAGSAAQAVKSRAELLYSGEVPEETRNAEQDFTTSYSRPLPGSARMYPETDIPAIRITDERVEEIDGGLPETLEEREEKYAEEIGEELASQVVASEHLLMFEKFREEHDSRLVANVFTNVLSGLESEGIAVQELDEGDFSELFQALAEDRISKGDIETVLENMVSMSSEEAIEEAVKGKMSDEEVRSVVQEVLDEKSEMIEEQGMHAQGPLMGIIMGRVESDGQTVSRILREELEKRVE